MKTRLIGIYLFYRSLISRELTPMASLDEKPSFDLVLTRRIYGSAACWWNATSDNRRKLGFPCCRSTFRVSSPADESRSASLHILHSSASISPAGSWDWRMQWWVGLTGMQSQHDCRKHEGFPAASRPSRWVHQRAVSPLSSVPFYLVSKRSDLLESFWGVRMPRHVWPREMQPQDSRPIHGGCPIAVEPFKYVSLLSMTVYLIFKR